MVNRSRFSPEQPISGDVGLHLPPSRLGLGGALGLIAGRIKDDYILLGQYNIGTPSFYGIGFTGVRCGVRGQT